MNADTGHPDPSMEHIKVACEKMIYDVYMESQPGLVASIDQLIRMEHNPTDIANRVKSMIPASSNVDDHVLLIALYLLRQQLPAN